MIGLSLAACTAAFGGGLTIPSGISAKALGMDGAFTAIADDGSAAYYNAAGWAWDEESFVQIGGDYLQTAFGYDLPQGAGIRGSEEMPLPVCALKLRLNERWVTGFSVYPAAGLGVDFPANHLRGLRYEKSRLTLGNFTPLVAYQLSEKLAVGAGLDFGLLSELEYRAPLHQIGRAVFENIGLKVRGQGHGLGYRLGLQWRPSDKLWFGLSYAAPIDVKFHGQTDVAVLGLRLMQSRFKTAVPFPGNISVGVAWQATERLKLACDFKYYLAAIDEVKFDFAHLPTIRQRFDWDDNFSAHFGGEYQDRSGRFIRAGVACLSPAVPETTQNPIIPDGHGYSVTFGVGRQWENVRVDLAFSHAWFDREINAAWHHLAPGDYQAAVDTTSLSVCYLF